MIRRLFGVAALALMVAALLCAFEPCLSSAVAAYLALSCGLNAGLAVYLLAEDGKG